MHPCLAYFGDHNCQFQVVYGGQIMRGIPRCLVMDVNVIFLSSFLVVCDYRTQWSFMLLLQLICTFLYRTLHPFPFSPGSLRPFLYSPLIVPSTPYLTTPVSGDHTPTQDSRPQHSRGHEACLSPPYIVRSLLSPHPQSRLTHDWPMPSGVPSHVRTLVSPAAILS